jgi:hypothetical protein
MAFYDIFGQKDTFITNLAVDGVSTTGSNHGASPSLSIFSFAVEDSPNSLDVARVLVQFDLSSLSQSIYIDKIIPSSSVSYTLKMFNEQTSDTTPTSYNLVVYPLSRSWDENSGLDFDGMDGGVANWIQPTSTISWVNTGSDYLSSSFGSASQHFDRGQEDLEVDITDVVINWLTGSIGNAGLLVKLGDVEENTGDYYRKSFHSRESKYVDRLPRLRATWVDAKFDNRDNFAINQNNNLYLYNFIRGQLVDLAHAPTVRLQDSIGSASMSMVSASSRISVGIYKASFAPTSIGVSSSWADIWYSGSAVYMTGTIQPLILTGSQVNPYGEFDVTVDNLKRVYGVDEKAHLIVNVRLRDYVTHVGAIDTASLIMENEKMENMYYSIENDDSGEVIVPFESWTQLSYNKDGNYFDIFMNSFVPGFLYRIKFLIDNNNEEKIYDEDLLFKVV